MPEVSTVEHIVQEPRVSPAGRASQQQPKAHRNEAHRNLMAGLLSAFTQNKSKQRNVGTT